MRRSRRMVVELLAVACCTLPGCGGGNGHATPSATPTSSPTHTAPPTATFTPIPTFTATPLPSFTATPSTTSTVTATSTATPTVTSTLPPSATPSPSTVPTPGPLGTRHFLINPARSPFEAVLAQDFKIPVGAFTGFLDLQAGQPDQATGVATIDIVDASDYIYANASVANIVVCIKPQKHVTAAGIVACNGGFAFSFATTQDHRVGQVGIDGYTAAQCTATCSPGIEGSCGQIESRNQICAAGNVGELCRTNAECDTMAGKGDGVCGIGDATCTMPEGAVGDACTNDSACDSPDMMDGVCGVVKPHPAVCNGPLIPDQLTDLSPPGSVIIAPNPQFGLLGLPVELTLEQALPCGDEGPAQHVTFALTSDVSRSTILHFSNMDQPVSNDSSGKPFSCANWQNQNGQGALVLSVAALDTNPMGGDVITVFNFNGQP